MREIEWGSMVLLNRLLFDFYLSLEAERARSPPPLSLTKDGLPQPT